MLCVSVQGNTILHLQATQKAVFRRRIAFNGYELDLPFAEHPHTGMLSSKETIR